LAKVEAHLAHLKASGQLIPMRGGRVNIDQLAKDCGLRSRQPFYTNKAVKAALGAFTGNVAGHFDADQRQRDLDKLRSKLLRAEQQIAALRAENDALRAQSKELTAELDRQRAFQEIALAGRRVIE
jgi:hypothetical protein